MTERRRLPSLPPNVVVYLGLSTGAYALSLAAVTGLQSASEAAARSARAPMVDAVNAVTADHDLLAQRVTAAHRAYDAAAAAYEAAGVNVTALDGRLADLAGAVADLNGTAAQLPSSIKLPAVSKPAKTSAGSSSSTTTTHVTTGASGA